MGKLLENCKKFQCEIFKILLKHVSNFSICMTASLKQNNVIMKRKRVQHIVIAVYDQSKNGKQMKV